MASARILGCRVDDVDANEAVRRIAEWAREGREGRGALVVTLGTEMVVRAQSDSAFADVVNRSDLSLCDTIGIRFAARLNGLPIAERVSGVDLIGPLCDALARQDSRVYLLGGKGDTAERAAAALVRSHPRLTIVGYRDGYFSTDDEAAVAAAVRATGANVVFAALGFPRQEVFLARRLQDTGCGVGIGVGGSLDVLAGNVERAPLVWQRLGLEWLYRLLREPKRWRRQLALPQFVWLVLRERATRPPARRLT